MRLTLTLGDLILFDVRLLERDEPETSEPPAVFSVGFCSTERSGPYVEDRQGLSEGTWERK